MKAARLYGPKDMRIDDLPEPAAPGAGEALIRVKTVGVCGSDLHMYQDGRIGDTDFESPLVLGHEFSGEVLAVGPDATSGAHTPLTPGQRVAVDPHLPCLQCEMCELGHPNLCPNHVFYGVYPHDGALRERVVVAARNCFPLPDAVSDEAGALLEPLGVGIHALSLAHLKIADSVAVIGCGPIGLVIIKLARLAGADPIFASDLLPWRVKKALAWGATDAWVTPEHDPVALVEAATRGRGVDVAFEAAWSDHSVQHAADMARLGGRLVVVGIPSDDKLCMQHSTGRRKGLTIMMARRMKHTYPRATALALRKDQIDLEDLISHRLPLAEAGRAYALNLAYEPEVLKVMISP